MNLTLPNIYILLLTSVLKVCLADLQADISKTIKDKNTTLSRQRRYLTFPEGASLQMIFDLVYPSISTMGNLITFGNTAVMAWKLPNEPLFLDKKRLEEAHEKETEMEKASEQQGQQIKKEEEKIKPAWNAPLYPWDSNYLENRPYSKDNNFWVPNNYQNPDYYFYKDPRRNRDDFNEEVFEKPYLYHRIHRRSRRDLYKNIEQLFTAFKKDGKACVLKTICQFTRFPKEKGSLIVEILKAIFKPRPYKDYPGQDHYDLAASPEVDCEKMFPNCEGSILNHIFVNKKIKK